MLSDMIDDLVRADCPQEKEAAYDGPVAYLKGDKK